VVHASGPERVTSDLVETLDFGASVTAVHPLPRFDQEAENHGLFQIAQASFYDQPAKLNLVSGIGLSIIATHARQTAFQRRYLPPEPLEL